MRILAMLGLTLTMYMSWVSTVSSETVVYTDKTAWENALGGQFLTEDFADDQLNPGVSFVSTASGHINTAQQNYQDVLMSTNPNEPMTTWSFIPGITAYGGNWTLGGPGGSGSSLLVYIDNVYVGTISNNYAGEFWGFTSDTSFTSVKAVGGTGTNQQNYKLDTMVYSRVPVLAAVDIEKSTNDQQADGENDPDVPQLNPGVMVTWTYEVSNTGAVAFSEAEVTVTDSQAGVNPVLDVGSDDGDMILSPGEVWIYTASGQAIDLTSPPSDVTVVPGCGDDRNTYRNTGRVDIVGATLFDEDLSHYCNPADTDDDGIPDNEDNCVLTANGPLHPDAGGYSQRDTDADGYGNICDPDLDNSGNVDFADLASMKSMFFTSDADADLDGDGKVDFTDLAIQKSMFFGPPGPSGLVP